MNEKSVYILSLGCPKNLVDSEVMSALLSRSGWSVTDRPDRAGAIVVNTGRAREDVLPLLKVADIVVDGRTGRIVGER